MLFSRNVTSIAAGVFVAAFSLTAPAQQPINIETWPDDVPCDKLKKNSDGSYTMTVPWVRFFTVHAGGNWKNTRETRYWDQKCKGKTQ